MNFDDAMAAHIVWKLRLKQLVEDESPEACDSASTARSDLCELGKWISGEGSRYQATPAFESLRTKHAEFHVHAAEVIRKVQDGDRKGAIVVMKGPFEAASREIIQAIVEVRKAAAED